MKFVVLSTPNPWERVIVGYNGEVFTISVKKLEELIRENMVERSLPAGSFGINSDGNLGIIVELLAWEFPLTMIIWNDLLLGLRTVCAFNEINKQWYHWKPL